MNGPSGCLILGLGGLELFTAELGSLAGRREGKLETRKGEAGPQSTRKSQGESLILRTLQFAASSFFPGSPPVDPSVSSAPYFNITDNENLYEKRTEVSATERNIETGSEGEKDGMCLGEVAIASHESLCTKPF